MSRSNFEAQIAQLLYATKKIKYSDELLSIDITGADPISISMDVKVTKPKPQEELKEKGVVILNI